MFYTKIPLSLIALGNVEAGQSAVVSSAFSHDR